MLEVLPQELLLNIAEYLNASSLVALQGTCKSIRQILAPLQWSHVTLSTRYKSRQMPRSNPTNPFSEYTLHHRVCTARWVINLPLTIDTVLPDLPASIHALIRVLTLDLPFTWVIPLRSWWPTVAEEFTITGKLLDSLQPVKFPKLQLIEVRTDHAYSCSPLVRGLLKKFPSVAFNIEVDQGITCIAVRLFDTLVTGNVKIITLSLSSASNARKFTREIGRSRLLGTVERCDLSNTSVDLNCQMDSRDLEFFFKNSSKLKFLAISRFDVIDTGSQWLPESIKELYLDGQRHSWTNSSSESCANLEQLTLKVPVDPSVFPTQHLPKVRTLSVEIIDPNQLVAAAAMVNSCPELKHLRLRAAATPDIFFIMETCPGLQYISLLVLDFCPELDGTIGEGDTAQSAALAQEAAAKQLAAVCGAVSRHCPYLSEFYATLSPFIAAGFPDACVSRIDRASTACVWPALYDPLQGKLYRVDLIKYKNWISIR